MKTLLYYQPTLFQILSNPSTHFPVTSNPTPTVLFVMDNVDLHVLSLCTLVPEGPWCVFYATRHQVYWGLAHNMVFWWYSNLISHKHTHTHIEHAKTSMLTHPYKYIFTLLGIFSHQLSLLHWMDNSLISKNYFPKCLFFSRIIHL